MNKSPILAFFLALIPGFGHMYFGRKIKGVLYSLAFFGPLFLGLVILVAGPFVPFEVKLLLVFWVFFVWVVNVIDMVITLLMTRGQSKVTQGEPIVDESVVGKQNEQNERFFTILLSFIPGVGHFHLGLNQRGLTFLTGFIGLAMMVFFVSVITGTGGFLVFLLALPVIWIYGLFDVIQLLNQKDRGEMLEDRTIMEDLDRHRGNERKSKVLATILGIFPGAGHMYMGLQRRGLQLMGGFLLSIYVLDVLRLSIFLFFIPIIWFFSFFDTLQQAGKMEEEELEDVPIVKHVMNHQRWIGVILILLGLFYMVDSIFMPALAAELRTLLNVDIRYYYEQYFQMIIVCFLFIGGGIKLLMGSKSKKEEHDL
ncbi:DUF6677 family protein [Pontibacillus yanchengensis]|uniref:Multi-TM2 domain-containing protein n=1 Tax=Pontibacillus yanchengensis Y32 TaxID=1385514 RepID=A0A0A2TS41_9BACI|nr:DUF6677 family protein [Pontibacillus yanchengensis]KGP72085.1 hypothetical protein N782_14120 [Pontibacillus yanchengensis Y32]